MIINNSGKIFRFALDHNQGFAYCEFVDFSDIFSFDGRLLYVFDLIEKEINNSIDVNYIKKHKILFGPVPLVKAPTLQSKEVKLALIGKAENINSAMPTFKYTLAPTVKKDWTKLNGDWHRNTWSLDRGKAGHSGLSEPLSYEEVRYFEEAVLHTLKGVVIRTTMIVLIKQGKDVKDFYDLQDFYLRGLFIRVANTSFDKAAAKRLLLEINDIPVS